VKKKGNMVKNTTQKTTVTKTPAATTGTEHIVAPAKSVVGEQTITHPVSKPIPGATKTVAETK
jgi:hypothetical protein